MGLSLIVSAWLFFRITGALFNPNISLALLLVGAIRPVRFVLYCIAQMLGAIAASALVLALLPGNLASNNVLGTDINPAQGVFIEMFITTALVLAVLMLAAEKHQATPFAPIGIGLTLFTCHLWAVFYTGACMNTARAFGPAVVTGFLYEDHWVYWVGPFLGSVLGATFYALLKHYKYWRLAPDQASVDFSKSPGDPVVAIKNLFTSGTDIEADRDAAVGTSGAGMGEKADGRKSDDSAV
ncbi:aquaporin-like protein [Athelia psychrophila]|uniref:Aquaporin-like protein n=1 Tax=Athelia psychrophila TaxID=1759441 RepID=A0A166L6T9_9AGAM|nr:aquaporin-like protein [Fibularhizoctonia sp. CBS 109695]